MRTIKRTAAFKRDYKREAMEGPKRPGLISPTASDCSMSMRAVFEEEGQAKALDDVAKGARRLYQPHCAWCKEKGYKARFILLLEKQIGKYFDRFKSHTLHYRGAWLLN